MVAKSASRTTVQTPTELEGDQVLGKWWVSIPQNGDYNGKWVITIVPVDGDAQSIRFAPLLNDTLI